MKRLHTNTVLFAVALSLIPHFVLAKGPKESGPALKISGETSVNYYFFNQSVREGNGGKGNGQHVAVDDSRINLELFVKFENYGGLEASGLIGLSGNPNDGRAQENRLKLKNEWFTFIGGKTRGVDDFMAVGAFSLMGGTGGFAGNLTEVLNPTTGAIIRTDLAGAPKDATKVVLLSPRIMGIQVGITMTPSTVHIGDEKVKTTNPSEARSLPFDKNQVGLGLNFSETLANGLEIKLSATGLLGKTQAPGRPKDFSLPAGTAGLQYHDTKSYALGVVFGYKGWKVGAEFIDNGKSHAPKQVFDANKIARKLTGNNAGKAYSVALGYSFDKNKVSVGYFDSTRKMASNYKDTEAKISSITLDRVIGPGLGVYAEANYAQLKTDARALIDHDNLKNALGKDITDSVKSNTAKIFVIGTKLRF